MSGPSYLALAALAAMVVFYAVENRSPLALLGFSIASIIAALSEFVLGRRPFGIVAAGFAIASLWRWNLRRHRNAHVQIAQ